MISVTLMMFQYTLVAAQGHTRVPFKSNITEYGVLYVMIPLIQTMQWSSAECWGTLGKYESSIVIYDMPNTIA